MAITFETEGGTIQIGTTSDPFPAYNISAGEKVEAGDGTILDVLYTVSVSGQVVLSGDITTDGLRQQSLMTKQKGLLDAADTDFPHGILSIIGYDGTTIQFSDATLTAVNTPEVDDATAGMFFGDYSFEFTARRTEKIGSALYLSSTDESWDVQENGERYLQNTNITTDDPGKTYTITHTLSATGLQRRDGKTFDKSAWQQAKAWCLSRSVDSPATNISKDAADKSGKFTTFNATKMGETTDSEFDFATGFSYYNKSRVATVDVHAGTYSLTELWYVSKQAATHDVEVSYDVDGEGLITVTVSGTIQGLDSGSFGTQTENKLANAEAVLGTCLDQSYTLAESTYTTLKATGNSGEGESAANGCEGDEEDESVLRKKEQSRSVSKNKVTGAITYSVTYNDKLESEEAKEEGVVEETITVSDDNEDHSNNIVAIIGIIGKADGPIFQDMGTTNERKRSVSVDWTMDKCNRKTKPTVKATAAANDYKPTGAYQVSKTESWTASTGQYTLNIEWVY
tara:strand:+ start:1121 stop:2656 length:1536 start_codon:yes stop_codon:yes gene_type:complete